MAAITLLVNGKRHTVDVDPSTPLLYVLRNDLDLSGPRFGAGWDSAGLHRPDQRGGGALVRAHGAAGAERRDHHARRAGQGRQAPSVQQAWIDEQVPACGYCQNGQILTAKALLDKNPHPTDAQIRDAMKACCAAA
jgi:aerobic-type carbon monoxide dehydrogenase small subunit (CoxS/CutS family)